LIIYKNVPNADPEEKSAYRNVYKGIKVDRTTRTIGLNVKLKNITQRNEKYLF
jgi:hypothetical protein